MDTEDIKDNVRQFIMLRDQIDLLTKRQSEIKKRLTDSLGDAPADEKGHRTVEFNDGSNSFKATKQRRVTKPLDMDAAEKILTDKGIKNTCIKMVPTLDEAAIMSAFYEGYLTEEDIDTMFPQKVSYALIVSSE